MRKYISIALIGVLAFSVSYAAVKKVAKGEKKMYRFEPAPSEHSVLGQGSSKIVMPKSFFGKLSFKPFFVINFLFSLKLSFESKNQSGPNEATLDNIVFVKPALWVWA